MNTRLPRALSLSVLLVALGGLWLWRGPVVAGRSTTGDARHGAPIEDAPVDEGSAATSPELLARSEAPMTTRSEVATDSSPIPDVAAPARDAVGDSLPVTVHTVRSLTRKEPVAHVLVEVGLGSGTAPEPIVVARATTDKRGEVQVELPLAAIADARAAGAERYWVRVLGVGLMQRVHHRPLPEAPGGEIHVIAYSGDTVRGRVFDELGAPTAGKVRARTLNAAGKIGYGPGAEAGDDGRFELHVTRAGVYQVMAEAAQGTACLRDVAIGMEDPPQDLELHLCGPGSLSGVVRGLNGEPSSGLELLVLLAELDDARGSFRLPEPRASALRLEGAGALWRQAQADSAGRFRVEGLHAGHYVVRARIGGRRSSGYQHLLTPVPVVADGGELQLSFGRTAIVVSVRATDGTPWRDFGIYEGSRWDLQEARDEPWLFVVPLFSGTESSPFTRLRGRRSDDEVVFDASGGQSYLVGLFGKQQAFDPVRVDVAEGSGLNRVELTTRPAESANLRVSVRGHDGEATERIRIGIESAETRTPIIDRRFFYEEDWPIGFELPSGRYRLVVEGYPFVDTHHGTLMRPAQDGRFEELVDLRAGEAPLVEAVLPAGGRVRLTLHGERRSEDREAVVENLRRNGSMTTEGTIDDWGTRATLTLKSDEGWPRRLEFTQILTGHSGAGPHLVSTLPIGTTDTSHVLPAGTYRLEARTPAGRVARQQIVVRDGETIDVTLRLQ